MKISKWELKTLKNTQANVQETQEPKESKYRSCFKGIYPKRLVWNLFDENGLTMLKEKLGNQSQEVESLKTKYEETSKKALELEQKESGIKSRLKH